MPSSRRRCGRPTPGQAPTRSRCTSRASVRSWRHMESRASSIRCAASVTGSTRRGDMKLRTLVVAGALAAGLMAAAPSSASANILWCVGDPPVQVLTPGGNYVVINNYLYVSPAYAHLARNVTADGYAIPDGALGSLVTV